MKVYLIVFSLIFIFVTTEQIQAQDKIVIDDRASVINASVEEILIRKFEQKGLELSSSVDFKSKCDYYFASINPSPNGYLLKVDDCDNRLLGSAKVGSNLASISNEEKAVILFFNLSDIIDNPSEYRETSKQEELSEKNVEPDTVLSEHDSRYFFAPSAFPLKEGELYYNSLYFLIHDVQYGISDKFTIGMGTTIIGLPIYFNAKYSIELGEKSHVAFGDLAIIGTYDTDFFANLAFGTYTYGNSNTNISLGGGYLYANSGIDNSDQISSVVGNVSGLLRVGKYFYLLSENYVSSFETTESAWRETRLPDGTFLYEDANFSVNTTIWYGVTGVRFVRRKNELVSWQFGLTHVLIANSKAPAPYDSSNWNTFGLGQSRMVAFPMLSFTRKFKL